MSDHLPNEGLAYASDDDGSAMAPARMAGSDDEGEDLMDNLEADYRDNELLDAYEAEGIDADFEGDEDAVAALAARRAAEQALDKRDDREGKRGRHLPGALEESSDEEEDRKKRRQRKRRRAEDGQLDEPDGPLQVDLESYDGPLPEFLAQEPVQREVARRFRRFLCTFTHNDELVYDAKLRSLGQNNLQSLEVDFKHLSESMPVLAVYVADVPQLMLEVFNKVALEVALEKWPEFGQLADQIFVRISNLPIIDNIRDLRQYHLGLLIRTMGVVTRRTCVYPQLQTVSFDCIKCSYILGPFTQSGDSEVKPHICPQCQSAGPFTMNVQQTVYRNYQRITLQESPGSVPAGRLPRQKDVILVNDLIDIARPGEEIDVVGIYTSSFDYGLNIKSGFPVFGTLLEANHITKRGDAYAAAKLTDEDAEECRRLGQDPRITQRIIKSVAPSIYGMDNVKLGLALALFGGCEKQPSATTRLRGDINMLLLGDPGTAKSQMLKYVERIAQRAVYTTGKGASAVGLTAAVQKDPITREWTLEGGALVLADKGVCIIDEFDKMNDQDRVSIHEAMEQQTISISKAGIVTTLQARCCVLAAANPIGGRYDPSRTFAENVELSDPILSRFDILAVIRDVVDPVNDERLATFVVDSHVRCNQKPEEDEEGSAEQQQQKQTNVDADIIPQDLLRKYITYAKVRCTPKLHNTDYDKIAQVYAELRREAAVTHSMPIAVRHLESIIRMSEAHARMHLREYISNDDIDTAIRVLLESFVASQKYSVQKALTRRFRRFLTFQQDFNVLTLSMLQELVRKAQQKENMEGRMADEEHIVVEAKALADKMREYNVSDLDAFYSSKLFSDVGFKLSDNRSTIMYSRGLSVA